jgi:hypothetical protein
MVLLKKLDTVLKCLEKHHSERHHTLISIQEILNKENPEIKWGETLFILNKLNKDGYVDTKEIKIPNTESTEIYYNINFEGRIFNEQNGYVGQNDEKNKFTAIASAQRQANSRMITLTRWIAIATCIAAVYYFLEILKYILSQCDH